MVTEASTADVAVILIDARQGVLTQTRRHLDDLLKARIKDVVLAINKMDLMDYSQETFDAIESDYRAFADELQFETITTIPMSALSDNVVERALHDTQWYKGPTLLGFLETVETRAFKTEHPLRFPVQWVNRPNLDFRGFSGTVEAGKAHVGQEVRILPSGETATIKDIVLFDENLDHAEAGQAVTIRLDREVDASRGDIIVSGDLPCEISDQFEVNLVWMGQEVGYPGRSYLLKMGATTVSAQVSDIKYRRDINSFEKLAASKLQLNDLSVVTLKTDGRSPTRPSMIARRWAPLS